MNKHIIIGTMMGIVLTGMAQESQATLTTIGTANYNGQNYNLIWEDNNNGNSLVWLDYSNNTNSWQNQTSWADGLNGSSALTYNFNSGYTVNWGLNEWRLPNTVDGEYVWGNYGNTTAGFNITSSEMGYLFYTELGNKGVYSTYGTGINLHIQNGWGLTSVGEFHNLQAMWYWSGTEYSDNPESDWAFNLYNGYQHIVSKDTDIYGLAVRTAQVSYSDPVPEPASLILMGTGLVGLLTARRKKKP